MKTSLLYCIMFLLCYSKAKANCTLTVTNQSARVTNSVFRGNGTCDVTISFTFTVLLNTGSRYMGMNISSPLVYSTPTQTSPEISGGPATYAILSFTGIQFNNINCLAMQANGIKATFWISTNDPAGGNVDLCESAPYTFPISNGSVLPIIFKDFLATEENDRAYVSWTTVNEINVKELNVQQKIDNGEFQNVSTVSSKNTAGNQVIAYKIPITQSLDRGNVYMYRIESVDLQGKSTYSEIRILKGKKAGFTVNAYPNPGHGQTSLTFSYNAGKVDIRLLDISGRVVETLSNQDSRTILLAGLKSGIYFINVSFLKYNKSVNAKLIIID